MQEIEVKLQVPFERRSDVDRLVSGRHPAPRQRLRAAYCDTVERRLASAGMALRIRHEGRRWVQTLKGAADDGMTRFEHNVARSPGAQPPAVDPTLHAGTPVGMAMLSRLSGGVAGSSTGLVELYRTDIRRRARIVRVPRGKVELAFDLGQILVEGRQLEVCELEIELLTGAPLAVIETARRWLRRFGMWLDTRSKAERGDLLSRGETVAPPCLARTVVLSGHMSPSMAWQEVLRSCVEQITVNASQVAAGEFAAEHVHQLRVGLRRLRSALDLFEGLVDEAAIREAAAELFRALGAARDRVVIEGEFARHLEAAMLGAGVAGAAPDLGEAAAAQAPPSSVLRKFESQALMLDLLAALHRAREAAIGPHARELPTGEADAVKIAPLDAKALRSKLAERLRGWHRQALRDVKGFAQLDDAGRHRLRKRAKRLRYAIEFSGALFEGRAVRRYLRVLRALQDRLGEITDAAMAMEAFARIRESDPRAMFALGWLAARRDSLVASAKPELRAFRRVQAFWR